MEVSVKGFVSVVTWEDQKSFLVLFCICIVKLTWSSFYYPTISSKIFFPFLYPFHILLVHRPMCAYFICLDTFVHSYQNLLNIYYVYIKCFWVCKWAYLSLQQQRKKKGRSWSSRSNCIIKILELNSPTLEFEWYMKACLVHGLADSFANQL